MQLDRPVLKQQAKGLLMVGKPSALLAGAIYTALNAVVSLLSANLVGISYETLERMMRFYTAGDVDRMIAVWTAALPGPSAWGIDLALELVMLIVSAGFTLFILNTVRGTGPVLGNLLDGFGFFWRILLLDLLVAVLVVLWSLALVVPAVVAAFLLQSADFLLFLWMPLTIPGIVAAYRYSMAMYILLDHPEFKIRDCLRESKRITTGYKGALFMLDLSFLGWLLLGAAPYVGYLASVWVTPYVGITRALYYERLSGHVQDAPRL